MNVILIFISLRLLSCMSVTLRLPLYLHPPLSQRIPSPSTSSTMNPLSVHLFSSTPFPKPSTKLFHSPKHANQKHVTRSLLMACSATTFFPSVLMVYRMMFDSGIVDEPEIDKCPWPCFGGWPLGSLRCSPTSSCIATTSCTSSPSATTPFLKHARSSMMLPPSSNSYLIAWSTSRYATSCLRWRRRNLQNESSTYNFVCHLCLASGKWWLWQSLPHHFPPFSLSFPHFLFWIHFFLFVSILS